MPSADAPWTLQRLLVWTSDWFEKKGVDAPRLTAERILASVLGIERIQLYVRFEDVPDEEAMTRFRGLIKRRAAGEPLQHILGEEAFGETTLKVNRKVLIPRPETEELVLAAFELLQPDGSEQALSFLDVGTGSGAIAIWLLKAWPKAQGTAVDLSREALEMARVNAEHNGVEDRLTLLEGDLFQAVAEDQQGFALIISNPPYIQTDVIAGLTREVKDHEPHLALDGGADGLQVIRPLVSGAKEHLQPGGWLLIEIGYDQGPAVEALLMEAGFAEVRIRKDLAGKDRIAQARR